MKLYPDSKVYVLCPGNFQTGGPELAHQLVSTLISFGVQACMVYYEASFPLKKSDPVHDCYKKYHVPYTFEPKDNPHNIVIVPEVATDFLYEFRETRRVIWWMSVNKYIEHIFLLMGNCMSDALKEPMPKFFYFSDADKGTVHFVQSEYAKRFIKLNGVPDDKIYTVEDYLSQAFLSRASQVDLSKKEDFVAFNPKKGFKVTRQLIEFASDIAWRPIENMTPEQVQELLARAKVYIDFGEHPGKDRIPREAAISGCVVITGRKGAAANDIDVNIPDEFKFDDSNLNPQEVIGKIFEVFENFSAAHEKQAAYRARILDDKNRFINEVAEAFEIKDIPPTGLAFVQGFSEETVMLAQDIFKSNGFISSFIVDDLMTTVEAAKLSEEFIVRDRNRNYLRVDDNLVEIITREDAKFLYHEGRIKNFVLFEPKDTELAEMEDFYEAADEDVTIFSR